MSKQDDRDKNNEVPSRSVVVDTDRGLVLLTCPNTVLALAAFWCERLCKSSSNSPRRQMVGLWEQVVNMKTNKFSERTHINIRVFKTRIKLPPEKDF